jgi:hypothetical protein
LNGVLNADNRPVGDLTTQERIEPVDNCDMAWTDGTHRTHLAINQFDTIVFGQNTRLHHAGEVSDSELPAENLDSHTSSRHKRLMSTFLSDTGMIPCQTMERYIPADIAQHFLVYPQGRSRTRSRYPKGFGQCLTA